MNKQMILSDFAQDTLKGLLAPQKFLSSKYFYDETGSEIFQKIMRMPEYYLTDCELEIFSNQKQNILECINMSNNDFELVELGAGDGLKTKVLLKYFISQEIDFEYVPIDISNSALEKLIRDLTREIPTLNTRPLNGDYFDILDQLNQTESKPKVILFLGSNIGNFMENEAIRFLKQLRKVMQPFDHLLIGFDLKKSKEIILKAYDDPHGYTSDFNLNLLKRMNKELGANFDLDRFTHKETYDEESGEALSFIVSSENQEIFFNELDTSISLKKDERIFVEISQKYNEDMIHYLANKSGFKVKQNFIDDRHFFMDSLWELIES